MSTSTSDGESTTGMGYEGAYIAHLWEHPNLCGAFFGIQYHTEEGKRRYNAAGITEEMMGALDAAREKGHLLTRPFRKGMADY